MLLENGEGERTILVIGDVPPPGGENGYYVTSKQNVVGIN